MAAKQRVIHNLTHCRDVSQQRLEYNTLAVSEWPPISEYTIPTQHVNDQQVLCGVYLEGGLYECLVGVKKKNPRIQLLPCSSSSDYAIREVLVVNPAQPLVGVARVTSSFERVEAHIPRMIRLGGKISSFEQHTFMAKDPKRVATLLNKAISPLTTHELFHMFGATLGLKSAQDFLSGARSGEKNRQDTAKSFVQSLSWEHGGMKCGQFWDSLCYLFDETGTLPRPVVPAPMRTKWDSLALEYEKKSHNMNETGGLVPILFMKPHIGEGNTAAYTYAVVRHNEDKVKVLKQFDRDIRLPVDVQTRMSMLGMSDEGEEMCANGRKMPQRDAHMFSDVQATFIHPRDIEQGLFDDWELVTTIQSGEQA